MDNTIETIAAFSTPIIAILAVIYTRSQARTDEARRLYELFGIRYTFYKKLRDCYLHYAQSGEPMDCSTFWDYIDEARFLFGEDVAKHIASLHEHKVDESIRHTGLVSQWFIGPFSKYLMLK